MADFFGMRALHFRAVREAANFLECAADSVGVACELDGGGVGQLFPLSGQSRLDPLAEKSADETDQDECEGYPEDDGRTPAATAPPSRESGTAQHMPADDADDENAEDRAHQTDVEAHVAIDDVAELVSDDAL